LIGMDTLAAIVTCAIVTALLTCPLFLFLRGLGRRAEGATGPVADRVHRIRRARVVTRIALFPVRLILAAVPIDVIVSTHHGGRDIGTYALLIMVIVSSGAFLWVPIWAVRRALLPPLSRLRGIEPRWTIKRRTAIVLARLGAIGAYAVMYTIIAVAAVVFDGHGLANDGARLVVLVIAVLLGNTLFAQVKLMEWRARPLPAGIHRDRWMALAEQMGVKIRDIRLVPAGGTKTANAAQLGVLPGLRYVAVTDYMITNMTDRQSDAVLAHEFGHARGRHLLIATFAPVLLWAVVIVPGVGNSSAVGLLLLWPVTFVLFQAMIAVHLECRADDAAARATSVANIADALTRDRRAQPHATLHRSGLVAAHSPSRDRQAPAPARQPAEPDGPHEPDSAPGVAIDCGLGRIPEHDRVGAARMSEDSSRRARPTGRARSAVA
jgi:STE24 endopeptidase